MLALTRRQFGAGTAAVTVASIAPPLLAKPATIPTAVTPAFAELGDAWQRTWIAYFDSASRWRDERIQTKKRDSYEQAQQKFLSLRDTLWTLQKAILLKHAHSYGDVVLKYHVFDSTFDVGLAKDETAFEPGGYFEWCQQLEYEAERFGVPIDLNSAFAAINGVTDRSQPEWQVIARWTDYAKPLT